MPNRAGSMGRTAGAMANEHQRARHRRWSVAVRSCARGRSPRASCGESLVIPAQPAPARRVQPAPNARARSSTWSASIARSAPGTVHQRFQGLRRDAVHAIISASAIPGQPHEHHDLSTSTHSSTSSTTTSSTSTPPSSTSTTTTTKPFQDPTKGLDLFPGRSHGPAQPENKTRKKKKPTTTTTTDPNADRRSPRIAAGPELAALDDLGLFPTRPGPPPAADATTIGLSARRPASSSG